MSNHERMARIEGMDLDTGQFSMTLATEGEASDGDILSIKGGQIPERMPMLTSHWNDPTAALGSITNPVKMLKDSPPRLQALGHIEMSGEGASAEIRRDLAHMIAKGHVTGVSIRWDDVPGKSVRRVNLPSDHPYFVDAETEKDHRKRYGIFFEEWRAMEGSVVALGADPQALIGRAEELEAAMSDGPVSTFWRHMANDAIGDDRFIEEPEDESPEAKIAASLAGLRIDAHDCREAGASHADMINAVVDGGDSDVESVEIGEHVVFLPGPVAAKLREYWREPEPEGNPEPIAEEPVSREEMERLLERLDALEAMPPTIEEPEDTPQTLEEDPISTDQVDALNERLDALWANVAAVLDARAVPEDSPPSQEREDADPLPAITSPKELCAELRKQLGEAKKQHREYVREELRRARGEVTQ